MKILATNHRLALCLACGLGLSGAGQATVLFDFTSTNGGFTSSFNTAAFDGPWVHGSTSGVGDSGGWSTEGQGPENSHPNTTDLTTSFLGVDAAGAVTLSFDHRWSFEADGTNWDGGSLFLAVNGGAFALVPGASFSTNGYTGTVSAGSASELKGLTGFVGASTGYASKAFITSTVALGTFAAGDTLQIRWRAAGDTNTSGGSPDWALDNVSVSNVTVVPEPATGLLAGLAALGFGFRRRRR